MSLLQNCDLQLIEFDMKKEMTAACIKGLKTNYPFREVLEMNLDDSSENLFYKYQ